MSAPAAGLFSRFCRALLRLAGWKVELIWPPGPRAVVIFYPHTSNWDFVIGILARYAAAIPVRWVGKDTLFRWPFNGLFRRMGGIPVNRREHTGFVGQLCHELEHNAQLYVAIAPEGTRRKTDHWKSGFYRIAVTTGVPLGLAFIDYPSRRVGIDAWLDLTGRADEDLARIRAAYADKRGRYPEKQGAIRFKA